MPTAAPVEAAPVNHAPTLNLSTDRQSVLAGERVRISGRANDPDGDALTYSWRSNGGQIVGGGSSVQLDTSGLSPGRYMVTGRVEDGRGGAGDSSVSLEVLAPAAPQASAIGDVLYGGNSARLDNVAKRQLDDVALRLRNERGNVVLVGYADPGEANPGRLAAQRAENAKGYLVSKGVAGERVTTRAGVGQAGGQNRKVELIWVPEGASY